MGTVTTPVILSGGSGTRLWPLSLPRRPKQLQTLGGEWTMIQETARRAGLHPGATPPLVVCSEPQAAEVLQQLRAVAATPRAVVVEPVPRNTAPAVAAAALLLDPDVVMTVFPADHVIEDIPAFQSALKVAVETAAAGHLVTFGIVPTRPETGYGYIEVGHGDGDSAELVRFVEKPDPAAAVELVAAGYLWNAGMFAFRAGTILEELRRWEPAVVDAVSVALEERRNPVGGTVRLSDAFAEAPATSIDFAVFERTDRGRVVSLDAGWSDMGSWQSVWEMQSADGATVTVGDVHAVDVERSYIHAASRPVAVIGLQDVVVVETADAVLVMDRRRAQDVRSAADWFSRRDDAG